MRFSADGLSRKVDTAVHALDEVDQANRVDVEDGRSVRIGPHFWGITGHGKDVAQADGVRSHQVHLHAEEVSVAAAIVNDRLEVRRPLLDQVRECRGPHSRHGPRTVRDVHNVDARFVEHGGAVDRAFGLCALWRVQFDRDAEFATEEALGER